MNPRKSKNQKKNEKRAAKAKAKATKPDTQHADLLLKIEIRKMLFPALEMATSKIAQHAYGALIFDARKMLFPAWDLNNNPTPSVASVPAFVTSPSSILVMTAPTLVAAAVANPVSDDEASLGSEKNSTDSDSPSSQSSVEDIEDVPVLLKTAVSPLPAVEMATPSNADIELMFEASELRHPILRRQFLASKRKVVESNTSKVEATEPRPSSRRQSWEAQLEQARNPKQLTLADVSPEHAPYLLPGWSRWSLQDGVFNAALLPKFADMRPSLPNLGTSFSCTAVVSRSMMSPPVVFTPPVEAPVATAPTKTQADEAVRRTKLVDEVVLKPEVLDDYSAPMVPIDSSFSDTEDDTEEFEVFSCSQSLPEIDSSLSDSEDDGYFQAIVPKKAKKVKVQADDTAVMPLLLSNVEADNMVPEAPEPTSLDETNAAIPREIEMRDITILSAKCAFGGALLIAGCAGIGALVARILRK